MLVRVSVLLLAAVLLVDAAKPDPPKEAPTTTIGAKKLAAAADCSQPIAFSGTGITLNDEQRMIPRNFLLDRGVGYDASTGIFTTHCPGLYLFSFAGYTTNSDNLRLELKRRAVTTENWIPVVSVGPSGGSNTILLRMAVGDQVSVFSNTKQDLTGASFSGYRFAKE